MNYIDGINSPQNFSAIITALKLEMNPIGTIYESVNDVNPSTFIGGTWVRFGNGRTTVGVNESEVEFDTPEKTGGTKTETVAFANGRALIAYTDKVTNKISYLRTTSDEWTDNQQFGISSIANSGTTGNQTATALQGTQTLGNLQPYITTYKFKRTA